MQQKQMAYEIGGMDETEDEAERECQPTVDGLTQCLLMLAEEAADLALPRTVTALRRVVAICLLESRLASDAPTPAADAPPLLTRH